VIFRETVARHGIEDTGTLFSQFVSEQGRRRSRCRYWRTGKFHISIYKAARFMASANINEEGGKVL
jgi:hypothetical protein